MSEHKSLINKKCTPCRGGIPPMSELEAKEMLKNLNQAWEINSKGHLFYSFKFENFMQALSFANSISVIAEEEGHHPYLTVSWGSLGVEIWTHKINGLSESDFILAAKIEVLE